MNKKLSNKDKKDWEKFVNSKEAIQDKDLQSTKKDFSYIELAKVNFNNVKKCIDAYNKKQEFGGGFISIKSFNNLNCKLDMKLEKSSKIVVN